MHGHARSLGPTGGFNDDDDFERDAEVYAERQVINVSPYDARIQIATSPGTKPRRFILKPGRTMTLQQGYCVPFQGVTMKWIAPWIETHTEREAWPGVRIWDSNSEKFVWKVPPGPRLPMVVDVDRADEVREQWQAAMRDKEQAITAPLTLTLRRQDGVPVDVHAHVEDPVPLRHRASAPVVDDEDQTVGGDPPPPDHDEPEMPVVTSPAASPTGAATPERPTRGGRGGGGAR